MSASLSGSRHLLLLASPLTPFSGGNLSVYLRGVPCTLNWVHPSGLLASVSTPTLAALGCTTGAQECGTAPLILILQQGPHGAPGIPGAYPPLQPLPLDLWAQALAGLAPFSPFSGGVVPPQASDPPSLHPLALHLTYTGLEVGALALLADATTPPSTGIHIVPQCTDSSYAPPEQCTIINGTQPFLSPGLVCVWGTGDGCETCAQGALCPGGLVIYPLPGFWCPLSSSPPSEVVPCPSPGAAQRCPGWPSLQPSSLGAYGCGVGYRGQGCSGCDTGYFPSGGACVTCPKAPLLVSLALPILYFVLGLGGFGGLVMAVVWATAVYIKGRGHGEEEGGGGGRVKCAEIAALVGDLCVWIWLSAQGVASLFRQAQSVAPGVLAPFFQAVTSLQFQGITIDPSCYSGIPFQSFWLAMGGVVVGALVGVWGALCFSSPSTLLLNLSSLTLTLGYGAITSIFSSATICTLKAPMSVIDYLNAVQDGSAMKAALGPNAPSQPQLLAALANPAANPAHTSVLRSSIPVSVLASDPFQVCNEGPHAIVRPMAITMIVLYTAGLPLFGLYLHLLTKRQQPLGCWWWRGRKWRGRGQPAKSTPPQEGEGGAGGGGDKGGSQSARPRAIAIETALVDATLVPAMQWTSFFEMSALAVITGLTSIAQGAGMLPPIYFTCQALIIVVCVVCIGVVGGMCRGWELYLPNHAWKTPVKAALYGITGLSALTCIILFILPPKAEGTRLGLAGLILGATFCVALLILVQWWRSLFVTLQISFVASSRSPICPASPLQEVAQTLPHPFRQSSQHTPPLSSPYEDTLWRRFRDDDNDVYWWRPSDGALLWTLEGEGVKCGDATLCGWQMCEQGGRWVHKESGVIHDSPPPVDLALAQKLLQGGHLTTLGEECEGLAPEQTVSTPKEVLRVKPELERRQGFEELMAHGERIFNDLRDIEATSTLPDHRHVRRGHPKDFDSLVAEGERVFGPGPHGAERRVGRPGAVGPLSLSHSSFSRVAVRRPDELWVENPLSQKA